MTQRSPLFQTCAYAVSVAAMRGISLLMLPVVAHYLTPGEFGQVEILSSIAMLGSVIVGLGLEDALFRFAAKDSQTHSGQNKCRVSAGIFTLALVSGAAFASVTTPLAGTVSTLLPAQLSSYAIQLVLWILALEGVIAVPLGSLRMNNRALTFCTANVGRALTHASLTVLFLHEGRGVEGVFEAGLIAALLQALVLCTIQFRASGIAFDPLLVKRVLRYSIPIVGSGILAFGMNGFDRWLIADRIGLEQLALYGVAAKFSLAAAILMQPFGTWWMARRFIELRACQGKARVLRFSVLGLLLLLIIFFFISVTAPFAIKLLMPETYHSAIVYLPLLLACIVIKEAAEIINIGCFSGDNTRVQFWINVFTFIIACLAMLILSQHYGLWGLITALLLAQSLRLALLYQFSQRELSIDYPVRELSLVSLALFLLVVTAYIYAFQFFPNVASGLSATLFASIAISLITAIAIALPNIFHAIGFDMDFYRDFFQRCKRKPNYQRG